jgi:hypothetical protein
MHKLKNMMRIYLHVSHKNVVHVLHSHIHGVGPLLDYVKGAPLAQHQGLVVPGDLLLLPS